MQRARRDTAAVVTGSGHLRGVRQSALTKLRDVDRLGVARIRQPVPLGGALDGLRDRVRSPVRARPFKMTPGSSNGAAVHTSL